MSVIYPSGRATDVVLRDGSTIHVRPVLRSDEEPLRRFFEGLDPTSRMFRFFSGAVDLAAAARHMLAVDYSDSYGLVATRGADDRIVGQGAYFKDGRGRAEVAFAVADELQGHGLATILLAHLAEVAEENGISVFTAEVMPENHRMVEVFRESGFPAEMSSMPGALRWSSRPPSPATRSTASRTVTGSRRRRRSALPGAALRRVIGASRGTRHGRGRGVPQPAPRRVRGCRLSGQPRSESRAVGARLPSVLDLPDA